jgi:hypothetical protein
MRRFTCWWQYNLPYSLKRILCQLMQCRSTRASLQVRNHIDTTQARICHSKKAPPSDTQEIIKKLLLYTISLHTCIL